jgi:hypothetical protein
MTDNVVFTRPLHRNDTPCVVDADSICLLCRKHDDNDMVARAVKAYICNSIQDVHIDEICRQCSNLYREEAQIHVEPSVVKTHILYHMTSEQVVMHNLLVDLMDVCRRTKDKNFQDTEDGSDYTVNTKVMTCYLKCVDEIQSIYRSFFRQPAANST